MALINGFVVVSSCVCLLFIFGAHVYLTHYEENGCHMTFMFEYPQFVRISLPANASLRYKRFGLYAFGEGRSTEKVRQMKFTGIPVIFIPGSRGSPKQVRSIASISLRKYLEVRSPFHFDFFALDLNDDNPALFGGSMMEQTEFLKVCIQRVNSLYRDRPKPPSIVLVGHSMGGVVAKGLFMDENFKTDNIKLLITLATPHSPAILFDHHLANYYDRVNLHWKANSKARRQSLTVVSIGGGRRDILVKSWLTFTKHADINVVTTEIADVWLSTDHYCILWCKELVHVIVRALFDSVDLQTKQITDNSQHIKDVFRYHLLERSAGKAYLTSRHSPTLNLWREGSNDTWIGVDRNQYTWTPKNGNLSPTYLIVPLAAIADTLVVTTINHEVKDWIFTCVPDSSIDGVRVCKHGENLSSQGRILPSKSLKRKKITLELNRLRSRGNSHVVVRTFPTTEKVQVSFDLFKKRDRTYTPAMSFFKTTTVLERVPKGALQLYIEPQPMTRVFHAFDMYLESSSCDVPNLAVASLKVPWNNEGSTQVLTGKQDSATFVIHSPKPSGRDVKDPYVDLTLSPECSYNIKMAKSLGLGIGLLVGKSGLSIVSSITVCLLMALAAQLKLLQDKSTCPFIQFVMPEAVKPYYILPAFSIFGVVCRILPTWLPFIPPPDASFSDGLMDTFFIPLFIHCSAFAVVYFVSIFVLISVIFQGHAFNNVFLRFLSKFVYGLTWLSEYIVNGMYKVPIIISAIMMGITCTACAGLAVSVGLVFYFIKMVSLYEDIWQEIVYYPLRVLRAKIFKKKFGNKPIPKFEIPPLNEISFHLTLILLWLIVTLITFPSVLTWAKNYRFSTKLEPDPFFFHGMFLCLCAGLLWQSDIPKNKLVWSQNLSQLLYCACVFIMIYAQTSIYRLVTVLVGVFISVTAHQALAPWFTKDPDDRFTSSEGETSSGSENEFEEDGSETELNTRPPKEDDDEEENEDVEIEEEEEEEEEQSDFDADEPSDHIETNNCDGEEEKTPSSEISNSSFENISLKDVKE